MTRKTTTKADTAVRKRGRPPSAEGPTKERISSYLTTELMERARNAAYWTPGLSVAGILEAGLEAELGKLERKNGGPFPPRESAA